MALSKFLDPKNDFCFKQVFGTEKNKDILIHFLNDILHEGKQKIVEVTFLKPIQDPEISVYRQSIVDVMCRDQDGTQVIVEMQVSRRKGFEKRAQYYAAKAYSQQILQEDESHKKLAVYAKLKGVIFLAIADFMIFPENKEVWKSEHHILDTKTYEHDLKDFYFLFLELKKFNKTIDELQTLEEKWMYFFKHAEKSTFKDIGHLIGGDVIIRRAFEAVDQASWTEEELRTYEHIIKTRLDNLAVEQQIIEDAEAIGEARGKARVFEESKAKGKEERNIEIAKNLLSQNIDVNIIIAATGLSNEQIKKLKN